MVGASLALPLLPGALGVMAVHAASPPPSPWVGPNDLSLSPVQSIGQSGHAYLYGWGAATLNDGSVLIGDYWNYQIRHYAKDGTDLGIVVSNANQGTGPGQHMSPYGIGVDQTNNDIYFGDVDGYRDVDKYDIHGNFLFEFNGTPAFRYPSRVIVGPDRMVYVIDQYLNHVYKFDPNGNQLMMFGSTGTGNGQFKQLRGIALDYSTGNIYVDDNYNGRVQVFDPTGNFLFSFGSKGTATNQFGTTPDLRGMVIDQANRYLYVSDAAPGFVFKFDMQGNFISRFGGYGSQNGKFVAGPREVTLDGDGNLWVGDLGGFRAQKFTTAGKWLLTVPNPPQPPPNGGFNGPAAFAFDTNNNLFVVDRYNQRIEKFDPSFNFVTAWGKRGAGMNGFNYPRGIAVDPTNNTVIVADTDNHLLKRYSNDGTTLIASYGGQGTTPGKLQNPHAVDVGPDGRIYVADTQNARVQVLDPNGNPLEVIGSLGMGNGQFKFPGGIALDPYDNSIWVTDQTLGRIEHFSNSGTWIQSFGAAGSTSDNQLQKAEDLTVDQYFVYVADADANRIKVWQKNGTFVRAFGGNGTTGPGQYGWPKGVRFGPRGDLYEVEMATERLQELSVSRFDDQGPTSTFTNPTNNSVQNIGPVAITGYATDNTAVASVTVEVQDSTTGLWLQPDSSWGASVADLPTALSNPGATSTNWSFTFNTTTSHDGYLVNVNSVDSLGNPQNGGPVSRTFSTSDLTGPTSVFSNPANGSRAPFGAVTVNGTTTDNVSVTGVKLNIQDLTTGSWLQPNGITWGTTKAGINMTLASPGAASTTWSYAFTTTLNHTYQVTAKGTDNSSHTENPGGTTTFTAADLAPPQSSITAPANLASLSNPAVAATGSATDNVGVTGVSVQVQNTGSSLWLQGDGSMGSSPASLPATLGTPGATSTSWSRSFTLAPGSYAMSSTATDAAGNSQAAPAHVSFTILDVTAPAVSIGAPAGGSTVTAGAIPVSGSATDDVGVASVSLTIQDTVSGLWVQGDGSMGSSPAALAATLGSPGATSTSWSYGAFNPAPDNYTITATATDGAANGSTPAQVSITVQSSGGSIPVRK